MPAVRVIGPRWSSLLGAAAVLVCASSALAAPLAFGPPQRYTVGAGPYAVALADLDGDGDLDAVSSNYDHHTVSVSLNAGQGTFTAPDYYSSGWGLSTAIADLDGDGRLDLATVDFQGYRLRVRFNQGGATFGPEQAYATGIRPRDVAAADVDGDGHLDLVVAHSGADNVGIYRKTPVTFSHVLDVPVGPVPKGIAVGDLDGDGAIDIVTASAEGSAVTILRNAGGGASFSRTDVPVQPHPSSVRLGDLDGDGRLDIATANENQTVSVLLNRGGSWAPATYAVGGTYSQTITAADFDRDGDLDLATSNYTTSTVSVLVNRGDGTFDPFQDFPCGPQPRGVAAGDVSGDGVPDLVSGDYQTGSVGSFSVLSSEPPPPSSACDRADWEVGPSPSAAILADLDGDGALDIATANENRTANVLLRLGNGYAAPVSYPVGGLSQGIAVGDLDADGDLDLAVSNFTESNVILLQNDGHGGFDPVLSIGVGPHPRWVALADLNGDGAADIVTADYHDAIEPGSVTVIRSRGHGGPDRGVLASDDETPRASSAGGPNGPRKPLDYHMPERYEVGLGPYYVGVADVTGDGRPDLVVNNYDAQTVSVLVGRGNNGRFQDAGEYRVGWSLSNTLADLDGDGDVDIAAANFKEHSISVLLNDGSGGFGPRNDCAVNGSARSVVAADMDGDGKLDLAVGVYPGIGPGTAVVLRGRGNGRFDLARSCDVGWALKHVAVADLDRDGALDMVTTNSGGGTVSVLSGPPAPSPVIAQQASRGPAVALGAPRLGLAQSTPNPARTALSVSFTLPTGGSTRLRIYDVAGRLVKGLVDSDLSAGEHRAAWNRITEQGVAAGPGVYLYRLEFAGSTLQRRLVLQ